MHTHTAFPLHLINTTTSSILSPLRPRNSFFFTYRARVHHAWVGSVVAFM